MDETQQFVRHNGDNARQTTRKRTKCFDCHPHNREVGEGKEEEKKKKLEGKRHFESDFKRSRKKKKRKTS